MINNNVSFTSKFNFVSIYDWYNMRTCPLGECIEIAPVNSSISASDEFYTLGIRTCTGGGLVDTRTAKAVGFHKFDGRTPKATLMAYIDRLFKLVPNPDSAMLIGGKTLKYYSEYSMEQFNIFEEVFRDRVPNLTVFKEHVFLGSESDVHYSLANDTWTIHTLYQPTNAYTAFDVLSVADINNNFKSVKIANGDILQIKGKVVEENPVGKDFLKIN